MWMSRALWLTIAATLLPVSATGSSHAVLGGSACFMPTPAIFRSDKSLGMDSRVCRRPRESASLLGEMLAKSGGKKKAGNANRFVANLSPGDERPSLVVFDLDNTIWTPELYQLRGSPKAGKDIWLFDGAKDALHELSTQMSWAKSEFALASRTNKGQWAFSLLTKFEVDETGVTMDELFRYKEIYTGSKRKHFERLKAETGIPFDEMIFFDDSTMNTVEIEKMGVLCAHCPRGLTSRIWENALQEYAKMKKEGAPFMGKTLSVPMALPSRTITIMVRHEMVGRLIGKQGIKLKALQAETGAKVTIDRRPTTETETKVIVKGTPDQVEDARLRISKICFAGEKNADGVATAGM